MDLTLDLARHRSLLWHCLCKSNNHSPKQNTNVVWFLMYLGTERSCWPNGDDVAALVDELRRFFDHHSCDHAEAIPGDLLLELVYGLHCCVLLCALLWLGARDVDAICIKCDRLAWNLSRVLQDSLISQSVDLHFAPANHRTDSRPNANAHAKNILPNTYRCRHAPPAEEP